MTLVEFIILLIIAAGAGALGQAVAGYTLGGCLVSAVVGFIGALVGLWLARLLGLPEFIPITVGGRTFPLVWAVIGSAIFSAIVGLVTRRRTAVPR